MQISIDDLVEKITEIPSHKKQLRAAINNYNKEIDDYILDSLQKAFSEKKTILLSDSLQKVWLNK